MSDSDSDNDKNKTILGTPAAIDLAFELRECPELFGRIVGDFWPPEAAAVMQNCFEFERKFLRQGMHDIEEDPGQVPPLKPDDPPKPEPEIQEARAPEKMDVTSAEEPTLVFPADGDTEMSQSKREFATSAETAASSVTVTPPTAVGDENKKEEGETDGSGSDSSARSRSRSRSRSSSRSRSYSRSPRRRRRSRDRGGAQKSKVIVVKPRSASSGSASVSAPSTPTTTTEVKSDAASPVTPKPVADGPSRRPPSAPRRKLRVVPKGRAERDGDRRKSGRRRSSSRSRSRSHSRSPVSRPRSEHSHFRNEKQWLLSLLREHPANFFPLYRKRCPVRFAESFRNGRYSVSLTTEWNHLSISLVSSDYVSRVDAEEQVIRSLRQFFKRLKPLFYFGGGLLEWAVRKPPAAPAPTLAQF